MAPVEVVTLVTSAGGLGALSVVLRELPEDFPAAVVVAQHLGGQGSSLLEILERRIALPVEWARDGGRIRAGRVTVCPPRSVLEILPDSSCAVRPISGALERPLDTLLASVSDSFAASALGVVLTGMGRDGAAGTAALRAAGGVVIAQDEETAEHSGMPRAAAEAGAHLVLPLHEIGRVVADVVAGGDLPRPRNEVEAVEALFGGPGDARAELRQIDWSATPLGPVATWSAGLRTVVRAVLDTEFPMFLMWGPELVQIGNDAYTPTLGNKRMQGLPVRTTWPELWDVVRPRFDQVRRTRRPVFARDAEFSPNRRGFVEEAYFTYCYSPLHDAGNVAGVLETSLETTARVLADRRLATLRALATSGVGAESVRAAGEQAVRILETNPRDIPFALVYLNDPARGMANLSASTGLEPGSSVAPHVLSGRKKDVAWPVSRVLAEGNPLVVEELSARFAAFHAGPWPEAPHAAVLLPIRPVTDEPPIGVLVAGFSPRLVVDDAYRGFFDLVAAQISASVGEARSRGRERERLERLAELDRVKTEFFSNVSHEFRTPLTLMLGPLEELLDDGDDLPPRQKAELELVRRNARRLLRLVGTMLDFSQIEAGRLSARFAPVDLAERTREIVGQFESAAARAGLDLRIGLEELPEPVWVDVEMWEKIVSNLLSNALKFTFDGGIEVTLRALPKHAELVVRDTGVGIPEEELPHVFKRFHRVHDTRARTYEGAGIGLALVDELVRRHHGRIRAASTAGEGATFTVWIPLGRRAGSSETPPDEPPRTPAVASSMAEEAMQWGEAPEPQLLDDDSALRQSLRNYAPGARVLIADDHRDMREYLTRLLSPHWAVDPASDGTEALELARAEPPDLVLADVMMPGLDGFALLHELRADKALRSTPVVLVTARAGEEEAIEGLLAGADDYIVKPFSARELVARVGGQLELARARRRAAELNAFRIGLSDALRALSDPIAIQQTACRMLVEQLGADRARFVEIDEPAGEFVTLGGYSVDGIPGGFGRYPLDDHPPLARAVRAGRRLVIDDTQSDPYLGEIREALAAIQIGAQLVVPLVGHGGASATLTVHQRTARRWSGEDVATAEEVAGRAWAEVERARAEAALRASQERYRTLFDSIDEGFCTFHMIFDDAGVPVDYRFVEYNPAFERQTGLTGAVGRTIRELMPDTDRHWFDIYGRVATTGRPVRVTDYVQPLHRWFEVYAFRIGEPEHHRVAALFSDVTARKEAELTLRASEERQAFLLRLSDVLRPIADPVAVQETASRMTAEHLDIGRVAYCEIRYEPDIVVVVERDWPRRGMPSVAAGRYRMDDFGSFLAEELNAGRPAIVADAGTDPRLSQADRNNWSALEIAAACSLPVMKEGRFVAYLVAQDNRRHDWTEREIALLREVSERTWAAVERARAEEALRESEKRRRLALDAAGMGSFIWYPDEDRTEADPRLLELFGLPPDAAITRAGAIADIVHPDDQEQNEAAVRQACDPAGGGQHQDELRVVRPDGTVRWLVTAGRAEFAGDPPRAVRLAGVVADITDRKRAEDALRESEENYAALFGAIDEGYAVMRLVRDADGRITDLAFARINPAFDRHTGLGDVTGRTVSQLLPDFERHWIEIYTRVAETGVPERNENYVRDADRWYRVHHLLVGDIGSDLVAVVFEDITERKRREERQAFLLKLSDALRPLGDPVAIQAAATRLLREHFDAGWCYYAEYDEVDLVAIVLADATREGLPSLAGRHDVSDIPEHLAFLRSGQMHNTPDIATDERLSPRIKEQYTGIGVRALLGVGLVKKGWPLVSLLMADTTAHPWPQEAVDLIGEVAERTWAAVERARVEAALRASEERQTFLLALNDALRPLTTASDIMSVAARNVGERLGVNRAFYAEIVDDDWIVGGGFEEDIPPLPPGTYPADEYGRWTMDTLRAGDVVAFGDTRSDARLKRSERAALQSIDVCAVLGVPLVRGGEIVAVLSVHSRTPRKWTDDEIGLVQEAAARTWPWVERARVEAALRESEAKYRSLFESTDEGFCIIEIVDDEDGTAVDYRFVEVNEAFQHQTGLSGVAGKLGSEVDPGAEPYWLDTYSDVVRTGVAKRFQIDHQNTGRWYDVYAARVDDVGSDQAAIVFQDITERKEREEQQAFLLRFSDALRAQPDAQSIETRTVTMLAEHLRLDRCWLSQVSGEQGISTVGPEHRRPDVPPVSGVFQLSDYPETMRQLATQPMVIPDVAVDPRFSDSEKALLAGLHLRALLVTPLRMGQGDVVWALAAAMATPRRWTDGQRVLLEEVAERAWAAIERARAERALRESEDRLRRLHEAR